MSFLVHELPRARSDKRAILVWLLERSPQGGAAWLRAYDDLLVRLKDDADNYGQALEGLAKHRWHRKICGRNAG